MTPDEIMQANLDLACKWSVSQADVAAIITAHALMALVEQHTNPLVTVPTRTVTTYDYCYACHFYHGGECL